MAAEDKGEIKLLSAPIQKDSKLPENTEDLIKEEPSAAKAMEGRELSAISDQLSDGNDPQSEAQAPVEEPKDEPKVKSDFKDVAPKKKSFWAKELSLGGFLFSQMMILIIGLAFLGGLFFILNPDFMASKSVYHSPVTNEPLSLYLDISNPEDELLIFDSSVVVSGKTSPNASVIISSKENDSGVSANVFGEWSKVFSLSPGLNILTISAFDEQGNSKTEKRTVYYSQEKLP